MRTLGNTTAKETNKNMRFTRKRSAEAGGVGPRRGFTFAAAASIALLACVGVAACGGSSSSTNASANAAAKGGAAGATGATGRFAAVRECLQKQGVTLPSRRPGGPGGGPFGAGSSERPRHGFLPEGVSRTKFQEALKKCGGGNFPRGGARGRFFNSAAGKAALEKFAACMRENGVNVPKPNTSGNGPVFDTSGLNIQSAAFRAAQSKCRSDLPGAFGGGAGGGPPQGAPGAPGGGAGGEAPPGG